MTFRTVAQLVALVLYLAAWWVKKAFGWDIQPSVLVALGGLLTTLVMHAPPVTGKWAPTLTKVLGLAFAAVAFAFTVAPVETAGALKLSTQIEATELTTVPTQSVPSAEPAVVEHAGSNVPVPPVAPDVVGGTTETPAPAGTLPVAPDAATPEVVEPPAIHLPDTSSLPSVLVIGCLVPALGTFSRRARRRLLAVALAIGLSGCMCSLCPSVKADAAQGARGACWIVESLTSKTNPCTLPDGVKLTADECAQRLELERMYLERHQVDCDDVAL